jgi:hypothetical protein
LKSLGNFRRAGQQVGVLRQAGDLCGDKVGKYPVHIVLVRIPAMDRIPSFPNDRVESQLLDVQILAQTHRATSLIH